MERMWTYQELLLSSNPVLVCGDRHLSWSRFQWAILFLVFADQSLDTNNTRLSRLESWSKAVYSRARLSETGTSNSTGQSSNTQTAQYQEYLESLSNVFRTRFLIKSITVFALLMCIPLLILIGAVKRNGTAIYVVAAVVFFLPFVYKLVIAIVRQTPDFDTPFSRVFFRSRAEPKWCVEEPGENLVDAVVTRKTTDPKDKAFGLGAVLERRLVSRLPPPDYSMQPIGLYRDLTMDLLLATKSPHAIAPAALHRCPGQPSWVADWSKFPNSWSRHLTSSFNTDSGLLGSQTAWSLVSGDDNALKVLGRTIGRVTTCFRLQVTADQYEAKDSAIHANNIRQLLDFTRIFTKEEDLNHFFQNFVDYDYHTIRNVSSKARHTRISHWARYLHAHRHQSPSLFMAGLNQAQPGSHYRYFRRESPYLFSASYEEILLTHISICNAFAASQRVLVVCQYESNIRSAFEALLDPTSKAGIATNGIRVDDLIISLSGLSFNVMVARRSGSFMELVSPLVTRWTSEQKDGANWEVVRREEFVLR
jgi:hypothetical protein